MKLAYPAFFSPLEEQDGFCVTFPDLKGCVTQGKNLVNAIENAEDAAGGWLLDELEDGHILPAPTDYRLVNLVGDNDFVNVIVIDMDLCSKKYGSKAISKTCTLPAWLNTAAEKQSINFSATLQEAILEKLQINNN